MDDDAKWKLTGMFGEVFNGLEVRMIWIPYSITEVTLTFSIQDALNFTSYVEHSKDKKYGSLINGTWNGMMADMLSQEFDMGMHQLIYLKPPN